MCTVQQSASEDDDIIAGSQKLSLKCPVSLDPLSPCLLLIPSTVELHAYFNAMSLFYVCTFPVF